MRRSRGFTMVELMIVIGIVAVLIAMIGPAVQNARDAARKTHCASNLSQIALALQNYEMAFEVLPPGTVNVAGPIVNRPTSNAYHMSWMVAVLPHLELGNVYRRFDFRYGVYDPRNRAARNASITVYSCPMTGGYAGCHAGREMPIDVDNDGVLFLNSAVRLDDVTDGCAHTVAVGEALNSGVGGWAAGTRATLRNTGWPPNSGSSVWGGEVAYEEFGGAPQGVEVLGLGPTEEVDPTNATAADLAVGGFGSSHRGGANFALCDGTVRYIHEFVDRRAFAALGARNDGAMPGPL